MADQPAGQHPPARAPDLEGPAARAWLVAPPNGGPPDWSAGLGAWLVNAPGAHPFWAWWRVDVIHLRPITGVRPAHKGYPDAEFEFLIVALDPDKPLCEVDGDLNGPPCSFLTPIDVVEQFHGVTDQQASRICRDAVNAIAAGRLSPDQDYRAIWREVIRNTVACYASGRHEGS